ncbi:hypothetical protein [Streptomyces harbinensis]
MQPRHIRVAQRDIRAGGSSDPYLAAEQQMHPARVRAGHHQQPGRLGGRARGGQRLVERQYRAFHQRRLAQHGVPGVEPLVLAVDGGRRSGARGGGGGQRAEYGVQRGVGGGGDLDVHGAAGGAPSQNGQPDLHRHRPSRSPRPARSDSGRSSARSPDRTRSIASDADGESILAPDADTWPRQPQLMILIARI